MNRFSPFLSATKSPLWVCVPLFLLVGCAEGSVEAELLLPEGVSVGWERAYNGHDDGLGALVPVDVMVYGGATGDPLSGVAVSVWTDDVAAMPVSVDEVRFLPTDEADDPGASTPEPELSGRVRAWDATRDQFVAFAPVDGLELSTDRGGVASLYLYVDSFPEQPDADAPLDFGPIRVLVSMGHSDELFLLTPR